VPFERGFAIYLEHFRNCYLNGLNL